jgi:hypothetical protein
MITDTEASGEPTVRNAFAAIWNRLFLVPVGKARP